MALEQSISTRWLLPLLLLPHLVMAAYIGNRLFIYPDQDAYLSVAENLLAGHGLSVSYDTLGGFVRKGEPTSFYGLGTPVLLAAPIAVFGQNYFLMRLGNILIFALSLLFFRGICRFWLSEAPANLAMLVIGLSPFYVAFNQLFLSDMPFIACELAIFLFLFKYWKTGRRRDLILSAVFVGLSLLIRANLLFFLPVIAIFVAVYKRWSHAIVYLGIALLIVSPYCIRNSLNNHAFFPFDGKAGINLWMFNSDVFKGSFFGEDFEKSPEMPNLDGLTEKQRADLLFGIGVRWIKEHPAQFVRLAAMKAVRFLSPLPKEGINLKYAVILTPYSFIIVAGFFLGLPAFWSRDPKSILILLLFLYTLAIDMVFMGASRHRVLYDPFFVLVGFNYAASRIRAYSPAIDTDIPAAAKLTNARPSRA